MYSLLFIYTLCMWAEDSSWQKQFYLWLVQTRRGRISKHQVKNIIVHFFQSSAAQLESMCLFEQSSHESNRHLPTLVSQLFNLNNILFVKVLVLFTKLQTSLALTWLLNSSFFPCFTRISFRTTMSCSPWILRIRKYGKFWETMMN